MGQKFIVGEVGEKKKKVICEGEDQKQEMKLPGDMQKILTQHGWDGNLLLLLLVSEGE